MGQRGPLPIPTAVKTARGTARPCRTSANEPRAQGLPKPAKDLTAVGKKEFKRLVKLLSALGVLGEVDGNALERYVRTWIQWRIAVQMLEKTGPVLPLKDSEGQLKLRRSPYVDVVSTLAAQLDKLEQAFGLTPSARSRINVEIPPAAEQQKARFFDDVPMRMAQ